MYKLLITKQEENKNYPAELKKWKSEQGYGHRNDQDMPSRILREKTLEVELTDAEFKKIKGSVISIFE